VRARSGAPLAGFADLPTVAEAGVPGYERRRSGVIAPARRAAADH
jgi:tripartite-type tricarboxylate transporter receptor subunit TctC